jgi:hypothetical protein
MRGLTVAQYRALDAEDRADLNEQARFMYDLGVDTVLAERAEKTITAGFVYLISHPRMNGLKIGRAFDPEARLAGYQTGCPYRQYKLEYAVYFKDCMQTERDIHTLLSDRRLKGEWFAVPRHVAEDLIDNFKECEHVGNDSR